MRAAGIVRRIDALGRVVVPTEIRKNLRMREGDPLEIFTDRAGGVILKKYSPIGELANFASEYSESLQQTIGNIVLICDRDNIISVSGTPEKEYIEKKVSVDLEKVLEDRKALTFGEGVRKTIPLFKDEGAEGKYSCQVIAPILSGGDINGAVIIASKEQGIRFSEMELKLAETAALFLAKQLES
ncbi:MAG: stage V sporulation protein T [Clostridiaceae bacterium]|nr:stage V sporulation protein T [Clostridiaceae bacterium]